MKCFLISIACVGLLGCGSSVETLPAGAGGAATTSSSAASGGASIASSSGSSSSAASTSAVTSSSSSATATSSGSSMGCSNCTGYDCCGTQCVDFINDPFNCGACGNVCPGEHPFCNLGKCELASCSGIACPASQFCCERSCCNQGELCCITAVGEGTLIACVARADGTCPKHGTTVCASPDTPIATPVGDVRIADLAPGDQVYTVDDEQVRSAPIRAVQRTPAHHHTVIRVVLATGAVLEISGPHPTADGRTFADLRPGDRLDGTIVVDARPVPYAYPFTYDILPDSDTGTYFAAGARIGTTMRARRARSAFSPDVQP